MAHLGIESAAYTAHFEPYRESCSNLKLNHLENKTVQVPGPGTKLSTKKAPRLLHAAVSAPSPHAFLLLLGTCWHLHRVGLHVWGEGVGVGESRLHAPKLYNLC